MWQFYREAVILPLSSTDVSETEVFGREVRVERQDIPVRANGHQEAPASFTHATPREA